MRNPTLILLLAAVLSVSSCDTNKVRGEVQLRMDVTVPENLASGMMRVFAYECSSGSKVGEIFLSEREADTFSQTSSFRSGHYDFVAYNFDIPDTFLRGETEFNTLELYTGPVSESILSRFILEEGVKAVYAPDRVVLGSAPDSRVGAGSDRLRLSAEELTENWHIEINADGAGYAALPGCMLSGEKTSWKLSDSVDSGMIYFDLTARPYGLSGDFRTFGHADLSRASIIISVSNGEKFFNYSKPVGTLIEEAVRNGSHNIIINDKIVIPAPEKETQDGGGFSPTVGEWNVESGEILI